MELSELVYALGEKLKKDVLVNFFKVLEKINLSLTKVNFLQHEKRVIFNNGSYNYWLSKRVVENITDKRFIRKELFTLRRQFALTIKKKFGLTKIFCAKKNFDSATKD